MPATITAEGGGGAGTPRVWRLAEQRFSFPGRTLLLGVVNITPDSFSDGGRFLEPDQAVRQALALADEGADLIDVGGESSRPGAAPVGEAEEIARVLPVIERLARRGLRISIDTTKSRVADLACRAGAVMINDISGLRADPRIGEVVARQRAALCLMHMRGTPRDMQRQATYRALLPEVRSELQERLEQARAAGIEEERICLDPGIGFAKTADQSLILLRELSSLSHLGRPLLIGVSRKSFIGAAVGESDPTRRLGGTLAAVTAAVLAGADLVRVHDVAVCRQAVRLAEAVRAGRAA